MPPIFMGGIRARWLCSVGRIWFSPRRTDLAFYYPKAPTRQNACAPCRSTIGSLSLPGANEPFPRGAKKQLILSTSTEHTSARAWCGPSGGMPSCHYDMQESIVDFGFFSSIRIRPAACVHPQLFAPSMFFYASAETSASASAQQPALPEGFCRLAIRPYEIPLTRRQLQRPGEE